jgi:hypothetical protein
VRAFKQLPDGVGDGVHVLSQLGSLQSAKNPS